MLTYYTGKNTPNRQQFIIENLRLEKDFLTSDALPAAEVVEA